MRLCKDKEKGPLAHFETPYVVHQRNKYSISTCQPLFAFEHPNNCKCSTVTSLLSPHWIIHECSTVTASPIDNTRYKKLVFPVVQDSVLHGFSGYFDTVLYNGTMLSIVPETHSHGMFSWFPIFFPVIVSVNNIKTVIFV